MNFRLNHYLKRFAFVAKEISTSASNPNIFYLHIPKCGGNSIHTAIAANYQPTSIFKENSSAIVQSAMTYFSGRLDAETAKIENNYYYQKYREALMLYYMNTDEFKYISGHFSVSENILELFKSRFHFLTILRDPQKRFVSEYVYNTYSNKRHFSIRDDIDDFLISRRGIEYGCKYVKILAGLSPGIDYTSAEAIQKAKINLQKFHTIGILEDLSELVSQIDSKLGMKLKIGHKNKGPKVKSQGSIITEDTMRKIQELCKPDQEIYRFALSIYKFHNPA